MWRPELTKQLHRLLIVLAISTGLYLLLYVLVQQKLNPVVFVSPIPPDVNKYYHGRPVVSWPGLVSWAFAVLIYAVCIATAVAHQRSGSQRIVLASAVFIASLLYLLLVHPLFALTALPQQAASTFSRFVEQYIPPLGAMYFGQSAFRNWPYVLIIHALVVSGIVSFSQRQTPG